MKPYRIYDTQKIMEEIITSWVSLQVMLDHPITELTFTIIKKTTKNIYKRARIFIDHLKSFDNENDYEYKRNGNQIDCNLEKASKAIL